MTTRTRRVMRRLAHEAKVEDLRDGRRRRASAFRPAKGRGSYRRKSKHTKTEYE